MEIIFDTKHSDSLQKILHSEIILDLVLKKPDRKDMCNSSYQGYDFVVKYLCSDKQCSSFLQVNSSKEPTSIIKTRTNLYTIIKISPVF